MFSRQNAGVQECKHVGQGRVSFSARRLELSEWSVYAGLVDVARDRCNKRKG
jgi:hypothetical protein